MVSTLLILGIVAASLALVWSILRSGHSDIGSLDDWEAQRHEIDIQIFGLLLNRDEERYLRSTLPRTQFVAFQRMRIGLALRMLRLVEENASMSMRLGQLAKINRDPVLSRTANEVVATAIQLRLNLLLVKPCLSLKWLFPSGVIFVPAFEERYRHLLDCVVYIRLLNRQART
jgi:hypothetical protein